MIKVLVYTNPNYNYSSSSSIPGWPPLKRWVDYLNFGQNFKIVENFTEYCQTSAEIKLGFDITTWGNDVQSPDNLPADQREHKRITELSLVSDHCFVTETELYQPSFLLGKPIKTNNITWITTGSCDWSATIPWQYHLKRIVDLDKKFSYSINYTSPKSKYFDALMGGVRPHRSFVDNLVVHYGLQDKFIKTLYGNGISLEDRTGDQQIKSFVGLNKIQVSHQHVEFQGVVGPLCNVVPFDIYEQTAYSVITETGAVNGIHMPTEKIAKAFLGYRLFVVFAGAGYLKHLRDQGFQTFDGIIDETYDEIRDDYLRWTEAFEQVRWLCQQPQQDILNKIKPIVEHNYRHVHTNFDQLAVDKIQEKINQLIL